MESPQSTLDARSASVTPSTFRGALDRLGRVQKSGKGGGAYSNLVNRPLGRVAAAASFRLGLTPNAVTGLSAACTFTGIALIALVASVPAAVATSVLLAVGYVLDAADGQLARLRGGGSLSGEWLDHVVDSVKIASLHLAVLVHLYRFSDIDDGWLLVPIGFTIVAVTLFFVQLLNDQLRRQRGVSSASDLARPAERASMLRSIVKLPHDYGVLCWVFVLLPAAGLFVGVYTALFVFNAVYLVAGLAKWFRDLQQIDAGVSG